MYGYALWDGETDWARTNPATQRPLIYWNLKKLKIVRDKLIQAGIAPERVQPVELLGSQRAIRSLDLDLDVEGQMG
jgi:hypothetical protein